TTIAAGSDGMTLTPTDISVLSTNGFAGAGTIAIYADLGGGTSGWQYVTYTSKDATTFKGCAGGTTGTLKTGQAVTPLGQPQHTFYRHNSNENVNPDKNTAGQ